MSCSNPFTLCAPCATWGTEKIQAVCKTNTAIRTFQIAIDSLEIRMNDVARKLVEVDLRQHLVKEEVKGWTITSNIVYTEAKKVLDLARKLETQQLCTCLPPKNLYAWCSVANQISLYLVKINGLIGMVFDEVSYPKPTVTSGGLPMWKNKNLMPQFDLPPSLLDMLKTERLVGLLGDPGSGKTFLLKNLQSRYHSLYPEHYIAAVSARGLSLVDIQRKILSSALVVTENHAPEDYMTLVFSTFSGKHYCVLIDDFPDSMEFHDLGLPQPSNDNGCTILFTQEMNYNHEHATMFKIPALDLKNSMSLFHHSLAQSLSDFEQDQSSRTIVTELVGICLGLPKAIVSLARLLRIVDREQREKVLLILNEAVDERKLEIVSCDIQRRERMAKIVIGINKAKLDILNIAPSSKIPDEVAPTDLVLAEIKRLEQKFDGRFDMLSNQLMVIRDIVAMPSLEEV